MFKDKKNDEKGITSETVKEKELDVNELEQVTGGSLRNKPKTKTQDISDDTIDNI